MEQQSSPGRSPVELRDCIEELVRFTLESSVKQTLEFDLGLSKDFCLELLREDPPQPDSQGVADCSEKVPSYPLYKRLASSLHELISSGVLCGAYNKTIPFKEEKDDNLKQKVWNELVLDKGAELVNSFTIQPPISVIATHQILKTINYEVHVQEPFFTQLKDGLKTVEGRCAVGDYNRIGLGSLLLFNKCLVHEVQGVGRYNSFSDMLKAESLEKVLPGITTIEEGVQVYRKFYTEENERSNGVVAICVARSSAQPYISMVNILSGLGYSGVQAFLGPVHAS